MIKYRLLRDNKESGPYSEEEMIAKGFKPYDLLWAEGKSAGWQYPSEIAAFKKYAPIVEEQKKTYASDQPKMPKEKNALKEKTPPVQPVPAGVAYNYNVQDLPARH